MSKKPLTHIRCIKSDGFLWRILASLLAMSSILTLFVTESIIENIFWSLFVAIFVLLGIWLFVTTIKTRLKLITKQYFIYTDVVSDKKISSDDDSTSYYLCFANNSYKKSVGYKQYLQAQIGDSYYLVQVIGDKSAISAFSTLKYYIDKSIQAQFKCF